MGIPAWLGIIPGTYGCPEGFEALGRNPGDEVPGAPGVPKAGVFTEVLQFAMEAMAQLQMFYHVLPI